MTDGPTTADDPIVDAPPTPESFTTSVWTSPSFWTTAITSIVGLVTGLLALFGHPVHNGIDDATIGGAAFMLAAVATAALTIARSVQKRAAIAAAATVKAAHVNALAQVAASGGPHADTAVAALTRATGTLPARTHRRRSPAR